MPYQLSLFDQMPQRGFNKLELQPGFCFGDKGPSPAGVTDAEDKLTDTGYKRSVFTLCSQLAQEKSWAELVPYMRDKEMRFEVVDEDGWEARLNELINSAS